MVWGVSKLGRILCQYSVRSLSSQLSLFPFRQHSLVPVPDSVRIVQSLEQRRGAPKETGIDSGWNSSI
ncbi:hypothetical protein R1flu_003649 [Riccia fluitans]|uniref:Uncharacterized protein n=1 Tax=Riccia fluitans TaxID=41844 RepID=A0ABD1Y9K7_9MARC